MMKPILLAFSILLGLFASEQAAYAQILDPQLESEERFKRTGIAYREKRWEYPAADRAFDCFNECREDEQCRSWSYTGPREPVSVPVPTGVCSLYDHIADRDFDDWSKSGVAQKEFEPGLDREGYDYSSTEMPGGNARECSAKCKADPERCKAWTFAHGRICHLKTAVPKADVDDCCTSGVNLR